jgi:hypothetical protein
MTSFHREIVKSKLQEIEKKLRMIRQIKGLNISEEKKKELLQVLQKPSRKLPVKDIVQQPVSLSEKVDIVKLLEDYCLEKRLDGIVNILSSGDNCKFISKIEGESRKYLIRSLFYSEELKTKVAPYLLKNVDTGWLKPQEIFFVAVYLLEKKSSKYESYYLKNKSVIHSVACEQGKDFGWEDSQLCFLSVEYFCEISKFSLALEFAEKIKISSFEYKGLLSCLLKYSLSYEFVKQEGEIKSLVQLNPWQERLNVFEAWLYSLSQQKDISIENLFVDGLCFEYKTWLPDNDSSLSQFIQLLYGNRDLVGVIPNLTFIWRKNIFKLFVAQKENFLWGFLQNKYTEGVFSYFKGISYFHEFLYVSVQDDSLLWRAYVYVSGFNGSANAQLPNWDSLCQWGKEYLQKSQLLEQDKEQKLLSLKVVNDISSLDIEDVNDYFTKTKYFNYNLWSNLLEFLNRKQKHSECLPIYEKLFSHGNLANKFLLDYFHIVFADKQFTQSIIVDRILKSRGIFSHRSSSILEKIEGDLVENSIFTPCYLDVEDCLSGFSLEEKKLILSLLKIANLLGDLGYSLGISCVQVKMSRISSSAKVLSCLKEQNYFSQQQLKYVYTRFSNEEEIISSPAFLYRIQGGEWLGILKSLAVLLGCDLWEWSLASIRKTTAIIASLNKDKKMFLAKRKIYLKWLESLNLEQKVAFKKLLTVLPSLEEDCFLDLMAKFLCRYSLCFYPNVEEALHCLRSSGAKWYLLTDLESWVLSNSWKNIRSRKKL